MKGICKQIRVLVEIPALEELGSRALVFEYALDDFSRLDSRPCKICFENGRLLGIVGMYLL